MKTEMSLAFSLGKIGKSETSQKIKAKQHKKATKQNNEILQVRN
jgi:hypothetical protein